MNKAYQVDPCRHCRCDSAQSEQLLALPGKSRINNPAHHQLSSCIEINNQVTNACFRLHACTTVRDPCSMTMDTPMGMRKAWTSDLY